MTKLDRIDLSVAVTTKTDDLQSIYKLIQDMLNNRLDIQVIQHNSEPLIHVLFEGLLSNITTFFELLFQLVASDDFSNTVKKHQLTCYISLAVYFYGANCVIEMDEGVLKRLGDLKMPFEVCTYPSS